MNASIQGCLLNINKSYKIFEHKGKSMSKHDVVKVLSFAIKKGYETTSQITEEDVEEAISK